MSSKEVAGSLHHRTTSSGRPFEMSVEGLRGVAALLVALSHALAIQVLDRSWHPSPPWCFFEAGHAAVLVFFMLSGYVIGLTNSGEYRNERARAYLVRRLLRILPIYCAAWALTVLIAERSDTRTALGNLLLLQNFDSYFGLSIPPFPENNPAWSLNYEAVYYLLFLAIWRYRPRIGLQLAVALPLAVAGWIFHGFPLFVSGYACGWVFWTIGHEISQWPVQPDHESPAWPVLSGIFLLIATHHFASGQIFLNGLGLGHAYSKGTLNLSNFALLPACTLCLCGVTRRKFPLTHWLAWIPFAVPLGTMILLLALGRLGENPRWLTASAFTVIACLLAGVKSNDWIKRFAPFGAISYGFYLVHFPLLFIVRDLPLPSGSLISYLARLAVWLSLSLSVAWFLERIFHKTILRYFRPTHALATP